MVSKLLQTVLSPSDARALGERVPARAGFVIYGRQKDRGQGREPAVIVSYMEGKVGEDAKMFTMPAGSIEAGETPIRAAAKECGEEVGIDPVQLLGREKFSLLEHGNDVVGPFESPVYQGVIIKKARCKPIIDEETSGLDGKHKRTLIWGIEVENIEALDTHLKGAKYNDRPNPNPDYVLHSARERVNHQTYPVFPALVMAMRTGKLPKYRLQEPGSEEKAYGIERHWVPSNSEFHSLFQKPVLPELEKKHKIRVVTRKDMNSLYYRLNAEELAALQPQLCALKVALKEDKVVGDSGDMLKLDTDYQPLNFYQECGQRVGIAKLLQYATQFMRRYVLTSETSWRRTTPDKPIRTEGVATGATSLRSICDLANRLNELLPPEPSPDGAKGETTVRRTSRMVERVTASQTEAEMPAR